MAAPTPTPAPRVAPESRAAPPPDPAAGRLLAEHHKARPAAGGTKLAPPPTRIEAPDQVAALAALEPTTARVARAIRELVRIPSQGGVDDPTAVCAALMRQLEDAGLPAKLLRDPTGRPAAVISEIVGREPGPTYVLDAVVDTAPVGDAAAWTHDPLAGVIADGKLIGRGAADSKAAAALFIELGRELAGRAGELRGQTILFFDAAEHTGEFQGIKALLDHQPKLDGVLIGYPGDEVLNVGSRGFFRAQLTAALGEAGDPRAVAAALRAPTSGALPTTVTPDFALPPKLTLTAVAPAGHHSVGDDSARARVLDLRLTGTAAHSGSSKPSGTNAAHKAARLLDTLADVVAARLGPQARLVVMEARGGRDYSQVLDAVDLRVAVTGAKVDAKQLERLVERALAAVDQELPAAKPSHVTAQSTATGPLSALSSITTNVDMRTTPSFGGEAARAHLQALAAADPRLTLVERESWAPFVLPADSPLRRAMERGVADATGAAVPSVVSGPSNVGNLLATHGIPATTGYGVKFSGVHAANESIVLDSIPRALEAYRRALHTLMGLPAPPV